MYVFFKHIFWVKKVFPYLPNIKGFLRGTRGGQNVILWMDLGDNKEKYFHYWYMVVYLIVMQFVNIFIQNCIQKIMLWKPVFFFHKYKKNCFRKLKFIKSMIWRYIGLLDYKNLSSIFYFYFGWFFIFFSFIHKKFTKCKFLILRYKKQITFTKSSKNVKDFNFIDMFKHKSILVYNFGYILNIFFFLTKYMHTSALQFTR